MRAQRVNVLPCPLQISDVGVAVSHTNVNRLFTPARIFR
jgi:hypothetical protein